MKMGTVFTHKETGEEVKVVLVGSDGRVAIEAANGKKSGISKAELEKNYTEKGAATSKVAEEKPAAKKPVAKKVEVKKAVAKKVAAKKVAVKAPAKAVKKDSKKVEVKKSSSTPKEHLGEKWLAEIKNKLTASKAKFSVKVHTGWTSLYNASGKVICEIYSKRKGLRFNIKEELLADACGGAAYNKKHEFNPNPNFDVFVVYELDAEAKVAIIADYLVKILASK